MKEKHGLRKDNNNDTSSWVPPIYWSYGQRRLAPVVKSNRRAVAQIAEQLWLWQKDVGAQRTSQTGQSVNDDPWTLLRTSTMGSVNIKAMKWANNAACSDKSYSPLCVCVCEALGSMLLWNTVSWYSCKLLKCWCRSSSQHQANCFNVAGYWYTAKECIRNYKYKTNVEVVLIFVRLSI